MDSLAIVGAGPAGAAAAYGLREADREITVFEKSRGVCGRAATRRKDGCRYDHGANYVKPGDGPVAELVHALGDDGLVDVTAPVWTFTGDGELSPGRGDDDPKWTWEAGITQLAKRLFAATDAAVQTETRVETLARTDDGDWTVATDGGTQHTGFDDVLLTPPAPQTATLLSNTDWADDRRDALRAAAADVSYRPIVTAVLHYPFELDREWYGLVNTDDGHDIGWLSREACKAGHVPDGEEILIVQLSPEWSREHYDHPASKQAAVAARAAGVLLDDDRLADPDWTDTQGWRYALPNDAVAGAPVDAAREAGLHVAGDWVAGDGRVHAAVEAGLAAADHLTRG